MLDVLHDTRYRYASEVSLSHHVAYLKPLDTPHQRLERFALDIAPAPAQKHEAVDVFGNTRVHFALESPHPRLAVKFSTATSG